MDIMETASEIKRKIDYLISQEGTIQYLMEKTLLPRERVERIYQLGGSGSWPLVLPKGWKHIQACMNALLQDVPYEGTDPRVALSALNSLRGLDIEKYNAAVERGETPEAIVEPESVSKVLDYLKEVAKLSGESFETIAEVYDADWDRVRRIGWLLQLMYDLVKAEQGDADAQFRLGGEYNTGQGMPKDDVLAHMWMNLAAAKGVQEAVKARDLLEERMTPAQLAEAQGLAREWRPKGE